MKRSGIGLLALVPALLAACSTKRNADVCCSNDTECGRLGLPPGSANEYGCSQGFVCQDFYCVAEADAGPPDAAIDARIDAPSGLCNPNAPFGAPAKMPNVNTQFEDLSVALTFNQLKAYFVRHNGTTGYVVVTSKRDSVEADFPAPTTDPALAALTAAPGTESQVYPSSYDLVLYFRREQTLFTAYRTQADAPFDAGTEVYVNGSLLGAGRAKLSADLVTLYWSNSVDQPLRAARHGGADNYFVSERVVTTFNLIDFAISADELTLYYSNFPSPAVFRTTRASKNVPFDFGIPVANVNLTGADVPLYVSPDDCFLYIRAPASSMSPTNDIWVARRGY